MFQVGFRNVDNIAEFGIGIFPYYLGLIVEEVYLVGGGEGDDAVVIDFGEGDGQVGVIDLKYIFVRQILLRHHSREDEDREDEDRGDGTCRRDKGTGAEDLGAGLVFERRGEKRVVKLAEGVEKSLGGDALLSIITTPPSLKFSSARYGCGKAYF